MEQFFEDYLEKLHDLHCDFIASFDNLPPEALDWKPGADMNSFCVLVVHTTGSARFWIGDVAMGETSNRDRDLEFQARGLSATELRDRFATLATYARGAFELLTLSDLAAVRLIPNREGRITVGAALLHALEHTGLHLGHAQMTRQLWEQR